MQSQKVLLEKFNMFSNFGTFSVSMSEGSRINDRKHLTFIQ